MVTIVIYGSLLLEKQLLYYVLEAHLA